MKKMHYILVLAVVFVTACQVKISATPVDTAAVRMEATSMLNKLHQAMQSMDKMAMGNMLSEDALVLGTDPQEIMDKQGALAMMDQGGNVTYDEGSRLTPRDLNTRKVQVSDDGKGALIVEQLMIPQFSKVMPVRLITHMKQTPEGWKFDFMSWNFIPANKDLTTIDKALEAEKGMK